MEIAPLSPRVITICFLISLEKEISSIMYLLKANKPVKIRELQSNVWGYQSQLETHTVETHIYRLRKKISKVFKDESFILSKDDGYEINKKE